MSAWRLITAEWLRYGVYIVSVSEQFIPLIPASVSWWGNLSAVCTTPMVSNCCTVFIYRFLPVLIGPRAEDCVGRDRYVVQIVFLGNTFFVASSAKTSIRDLDKSHILWDLNAG